MVAPHGYLMTPVFGGQEGDKYNDMFGTRKDEHGRFLALSVENANTVMIDMDHPIQRIDVYRSENSHICGMHVTYRIAGQPHGTVTLERGYATRKHDTTGVFHDTEVLLAVFGRAGPVSASDSTQAIHSIGFILFNAAKGTSRVHGPFGDINGSKPGESFYVTNVIGFGGFEDRTGDTGISGLCFVKDVNKP